MEDFDKKLLKILCFVFFVSLSITYQRSNHELPETFNENLQIKCGGGWPYFDKNVSTKNWQHWAITTLNSESKEGEKQIYNTHTDTHTSSITHFPLHTFTSFVHRMMGRRRRADRPVSTKAAFNHQKKASDRPEERPCPFNIHPSMIRALVSFPEICTPRNHFFRPKCRAGGYVWGGVVTRVFWGDLGENLKE